MRARTQTHAHSTTASWAGVPCHAFRTWPACVVWSNGILLLLLLLPTRLAPLISANLRYSLYEATSNMTLTQSVALPNSDPLVLESTSMNMTVRWPPCDVKKNNSTAVSP